MSAIPQEILIIIFQDLWNRGQVQTLKQCQYVCRSWYQPAHILCLKSITIKSIRKFIRSIDANPHLTYLNAVEYINIICPPQQKYLRCIVVKTQPLDKKTVNKVFCRFPNLENIKFVNCMNTLSKFNDGMCKTILDSCPRLERFSVIEQNQELYYRLLPRLRLLLTSIHLESDNLGNENVEAIYSSLRSFPRLREITGEEFGCHSVQDCLSFLNNNLPSLQQLHIAYLRNDDADFFRQFTEEQQGALIRQLANIKDVFINRKHFSIASMQFIVKYVTSPAYIRFTCCDGDRWTDQHHQTFVDVVKWMSLASSRVDVDFSGVQHRQMQRYIPAIVDAFSSDNRNKRVLELWTRSNQEWKEVRIRMDRGVSRLTITASNNAIAELENSISGMYWDDLKIEHRALLMFPEGMEFCPRRIILAPMRVNI